MSEPTLKPCPFCGADAEFETTTDPDGECNCVCCPDCTISMMDGPIGIGWYKTKEDAAEAWNQRAPNTASTAVNRSCVRSIPTPDGVDQNAQAQQDAVAYWAAVADNGELVVAYPANDGNNGETARTECNQYINDALLNDRAAFRLVRLFIHAARPQQASVPDGWPERMKENPDTDGDDNPSVDGIYGDGYADGWNAALEAAEESIAAAPKPEGE